MYNITTYVHSVFEAECSEMFWEFQLQMFLNSSISNYSGKFLHFRNIANKYGTPANFVTRPARVGRDTSLPP